VRKNRWWREVGEDAGPKVGYQVKVRARQGKIVRITKREHQYIRKKTKGPNAENPEALKQGLKDARNNGKGGVTALLRLRGKE